MHFKFEGVSYSNTATHYERSGWNCAFPLRTTNAHGVDSSLLLRLSLELLPTQNMNWILVGMSKGIKLRNSRTTILVARSQLAIKLTGSTSHFERRHTYRQDILAGPRTVLEDVENEILDSTGTRILHLSPPASRYTACAIPETVNVTGVGPTGRENSPTLPRKSALAKFDRQ
jgi:hypothetical protein